MRYRVHIERLVLDGLSVEARDRGRVAVALEAELGRLLVTRGLSKSWLAGGAVPTLSAPPFQGGGGDPARLGAGVAQAVHQSLIRDHFSGGRT